MSKEPSNIIQEEQKQVAQGGVWTDENLNQSLDWAGESTSALAGEDADKTYIPKSHQQIDKEILDRANITPDIINVLTKRIEQKILGSQSSPGLSLTEMIAASMRDESEKVQRWLDSQNKRYESLASNLSANQSVKPTDIARINEKLSLLEQKISAILIENASEKHETFALVKEASQIIKDRRAIEEVETDTTPSVIGRFDDRMNSLTEQLKRIEPHIDSSSRIVSTRVERVSNVRKKFGKRM